MPEPALEPPVTEPVIEPAAEAAAEKDMAPLGVIGQTKRMLRIAVGFILLTIGALFGLVPLIPGWPLGILGLSILAAEFVWARRLMKRLRKQGVRLRDAVHLGPRKPKKPRRAPAD